jgi:tRNA pseudouridine38-40 synthase
MARFFIQLSYNGSKFNGWQVQENTPHTIQQIIEEKLSVLLREKTEITGCGRTDTGVHASLYFAHLDTAHLDTSEAIKQLIYKLNITLPHDIAIHSIQQVKTDAHARYNATSRTYHYYLHQQKNPFLHDTSWYLYGPIDFELMNKAAKILLETKDFTSFSKLNTQTKTNICTVSEAYWEQVKEHEWRFVISADRFLRNMVRAIVGTLLMVGRFKITIEEFKQIIEEKKRTEAGMSAPAHALFLTDVKYSDEIFL